MVEKEMHFIMIKRSIHQQVIKILNNYVSNKVPKHMKQTLREIKDSVRTGRLQTPHFQWWLKQQAEDQQGNRKCKQHFKPNNRAKRYL